MVRIQWLTTQQNRAGHPERTGSQKLLRSLMFAVFDHIDQTGHQFLWDELIDCLDDEAKARGYNGINEVRILSTGRPRHGANL